MAIYQIDVRTPRNRDLFFAITSENLRSEVRIDALAGKSNGRLQAVGGMIPGMRLEVDTKTNTARIIDRMHLPENKALDQRIRELPDEEKFPGSNTFTVYSKEPVREFKLVKEPPYNLATWLFWVRRYVDTDRARMVQGTLPSMEEIRKMGVIWLAQSSYVNSDKADKLSYLYPEDCETAVAS